GAVVLGEVGRANRRAGGQLVVDRHAGAEQVVLAGVEVGPGPAAQGGDGRVRRVVVVALAEHQRVGRAVAVGDGGQGDAAVDVEDAVGGLGGGEPGARAGGGAGAGHCGGGGAGVGAVAVHAEVVGDAVGGVGRDVRRHRVGRADEDLNDGGPDRVGAVAVGVLALRQVEQVVDVARLQVGQQGDRPAVELRRVG